MEVSRQVVQLVSPSGLPGLSTGGSIITESATLSPLAMAQCPDSADDAERFFRMVFGSVPTGLLVIDAETHQIADCNAAAADLADLPRNELLGLVCHRHVCPAEVGRCPITDLGQHIDNSERKVVRRDGTLVPVLKTVVPIMWRGRQHLVESLVDITALKQAQTALQTSQALYNTTVDALADSVHVVDEDLRIVLTNEAFRETAVRFGLEAEVIGRKLIDVYGFLSSEVENQYRQVFATGQAISTEEVTTLAGAPIHTETKKTPVFSAGPDPKVVRVVTTIRDISERIAYEQQLAYMACHDPLTSLVSHRHLMTRLDEELARARRGRQHLAVMMMDIDGFKLVNDRFGHMVGDEVLRSVATLLRETLRSTDVVGRYGGDEFMAILTETDPVGARNAAERIASAISARRLDFARTGRTAEDDPESPVDGSMRESGGSLPLRLSIGLAVYPDDASSRSGLIGFADAAMYESKRGRLVCTCSSRTDNGRAPASREQPP
jgi:diguanylate cyclase (GGDEF)-like protein/PAS domain S-box-containing protein